MKYWSLMNSCTFGMKRTKIGKYLSTDRPPKLNPEQAIKLACYLCRGLQRKVLRSRLKINGSSTSVCTLKNWVQRSGTFSASPICRLTTQVRLTFHISSTFISTGSEGLLSYQAMSRTNIDSCVRHQHLQHDELPRAVQIQERLH